MENEINNLITQDNISNEEIKNLIYTIREKQVMLDSDVARLYHYETRRINETVKRNSERFPIEFEVAICDFKHTRWKTKITLCLYRERYFDAFRFTKK